jgi:hypothetical protein
LTFCGLLDEARSIDSNGALLASNETFLLRKIMGIAKHVSMRLMIGVDEGE